MTALDYPAAERERQYNPRVAVPDHEAKIAGRASDSRGTRARFACEPDIRFGPGPKETLDIFPASAPGAPVQVYFHGGYWRGGDKADIAFVAEPFLGAGACVVLPNYDLCPDVTLAELLAQTRRAIAWTHANVGQFNGDAGRIFLSGSSAGGHITAMAMAHDWAAEGMPPGLIKGAAPITGVHDVEPVPHISVNDDIRLAPGDVAAVNPMANPPQGDHPVIVAVGGAETESWIAMSRDYAALCREAGLAVTYLEPEGKDHFTITASMGEAESPLARAMLAQMGLGRG